MPSPTQAFNYAKTGATPRPPTGKTGTLNRARRDPTTHIPHQFRYWARLAPRGPRGFGHPPSAATTRFRGQRTPRRPHTRPAALQRPRRGPCRPAGRGRHPKPLSASRTPPAASPARRTEPKKNLLRARRTPLPPHRAAPPPSVRWPSGSTGIDDAPRARAAASPPDAAVLAAPPVAARGDGAPAAAGGRAPWPRRAYGRPMTFPGRGGRASLHVRRGGEAPGAPHTRRRPTHAAAPPRP